MIKRINIKMLLGLFLLSSTLCYWIVFSIENERIDNAIENLRSEEYLLVKSVSDTIESNLNSIKTDLVFVRDLIENDVSSTSLGDYETVLINFTHAKAKYDQVRYIDYQGNEKLRINYIGERAVKVDGINLQNKHDRYYVKNTLDLDYGDIYVSALDLNIEHGDIEVPYKPMIRFVTPLKNKQGIVVLNYLASDLLDQIKSIDDSSIGQIYLLNNDGYYLYSGKTKIDFAFMFDEVDDNYFQGHKADSDVLNHSSQMLSEEGLFTTEIYDFTRDYTSVVSKNSVAWHIISQVPSDYKYIKALVNILDRIYMILIDYRLVFFIIFIISLMISYLSKCNERHVSRLKYLSEYDELTQILNRRSGLNKLKQKIRKNEAFSLVFMDLDGLKDINDKLGHHQGDLLIKEFVCIVNSCIRQQDVFARFGGDEFILAIDSIHFETTEIICNRVAEMISNTNASEEFEFVISFSYGIEKISKHTTRNIHDILKVADEKMYKEKFKKSTGISI